jgi:hypothetical protein
VVIEPHRFGRVGSRRLRRVHRVETRRRDGLDVDNKDDDRKRTDITNVLKLYSALAGESNAL